MQLRSYFPLVFLFSFSLISFSTHAADIQDSLWQLNIGSANTHSFSDSEAVDTYNGALMLSAEDIRLPGDGGLNISIARRYNSGHPGIWGPIQWQFNFGYIYTQIAKGVRSYRIELPHGHSELLMQADKAKHDFFSASGLVGYRPDYNKPFDVTSPEGTSYHFKPIYYKLVGRDFLTVWGLAKVTDRHGNYYKLVYNNDNFKRPTRITASDGREIKLGYGGNGCPNNTCLTTVTVNGESWHYYYQRAGKGTLLNKVVSPSGQTWRYDYQQFELSPRHKWTLLTKVINSHQGVTRYTYKHYPMSSGEAKIAGLKKRLAYDNQGTLLGRWDITWDSSEENSRYRMLKILGPKANWYYHNYHKHNKNDNYKIGTPYVAIVTDKNNKTLKRTEYRWQGQKITTHPCYYTPKMLDTDCYAVRLASTHVSLDDTSYTTSYSNFTKTGLPQAVSEQGERTRDLEYSYQDHASSKQKDLLSRVVLNGTEIEANTFNEAGNIASNSHFGELTRYSYDVHGNVLSKTDANNNATTFASYWHGLAQSTRDALGQEVKKDYDVYGNLLSLTDARGNKTTQQFDADNRLVLRTPPIGAATRIEYDHKGSITTTQGDYKKIQHQDGHGRILLETEEDLVSHDTLSTSYAYDPDGRLIFQSFKQAVPDSTGVYTTYDLLGRITSQSTPYQADKTGAKTTRFEYSGNSLKETAANGSTTHRLYESYGDPSKKNLIGIETALGNQSMVYDAFGNLLNITQAGLTRSYHYDNHNCLVAESNPESSDITYEVDPLCHVLSKQQGSNSTTYKYDALYQLLESAATDSPRNTFDYDANGNQISASNSNLAWTYTYDENNRLTQEQASHNDQVLYRRIYGYDNQGNLNKLTGPLVGNQQPNFSALGHLISWPGIYSHVEYNDQGHLATLTSASGWLQSYLYNSSQQISHLSIKDKSNQLVTSQDFTYDAVNNITAITDNVHPEESITADYDGRMRLTTATGNWGSLSYTYDTLSNITAKLLNDDRVDYHYDANRLTSAESLTDSFTINTNELGQLTSAGQGDTYQYNGFGQLTEVTGSHPSSYQYDANGNRIVVTEAGESRYTLYNQAGELVYEQSLSGDDAKEYLNWQGNALAEFTAANSSYYFNDLFGSSIYSVDNTGESNWRKGYQPYGKVSIFESTTQQAPKAGELGHSGKFKDTTELSYYGSRFYDESLGRFLSLDPAQINPESLESFNRYAYVNNNPYKYKDPDGRIAFLIPAFAMAMKAVDWGMTAYDAYNAYQADGMAGVGKEMAMAGTTSAIPGAKFIGKIGGKFAAKEMERVRHFTNSKGIKGIKQDGVIKASDQNSVFTVKAKGRVGSSRDIERSLQIKRGRAENYVDFDAHPSEFDIVKNHKTGSTERVFKGNIDLSGRNPSFYRNR